MRRGRPGDGDLPGRQNPLRVVRTGELRLYLSGIHHIILRDSNKLQLITKVIVTMATSNSLCIGCPDFYSGAATRTAGLGPWHFSSFAGNSNFLVSVCPLPHLLGVSPLRDAICNVCIHVSLAGVHQILCCLRLEAVFRPLCVLSIESNAWLTACAQ